MSTNQGTNQSAGTKRRRFTDEQEAFLANHLRDGTPQTAAAAAFVFMWPLPLDATDEARGKYVSQIVSAYKKRREGRIGGPKSTTRPPGISTDAMAPRPLGGDPSSRPCEIVLGEPVPCVLGGDPGLGPAKEAEKPIVVPVTVGAPTAPVGELSEDGSRLVVTSAPPSAQVMAPRAERVRHATNLLLNGPLSDSARASVADILAEQEQVIAEIGASAMTTANVVLRLQARRAPGESLDAVLTRLIEASAPSSATPVTDGAAQALSTLVSVVRDLADAVAGAASASADAVAARDLTIETQKSYIEYLQRQPGIA